MMVEPGSVALSAAGSGGLVKKVCLFRSTRTENFHGYSIDCLDPASYFPRRPSLWGFHKWSRTTLEAESIDRMYREKDPAYMRFLGDFIAKFKDADLLVFATYNPIHPEVLCNELIKPIKVLGFIDDPASTYVRGIPYLWAFDGAFYISPSYSGQFLFKESLPRWGCEHHYWWPLVPPKAAVDQKGTNGLFWPLLAPRTEAVQRGDAFFRERDLDVIYVGNAYGPKTDRLIQLKKKLGSRLQIYGRWPLAGYSGTARWLLGRPALWARVPTISDQERAALYYRTKIGINMHFSTRPTETGNMRMYEVPA